MHQKRNRFTEVLSAVGSGKERDQLLDNLAILVSSGMAVSAALQILVHDLDSGYLKKCMERVIADLNAGSPLWRALENQTIIFSSHALSLIRIGEETGHLAENLKIVASQQNKERDFRSKVRSAMMYPVFVLTLTGVMGTGIAWFILPRLAGVFKELDIELPLITRMLINTGEFLGTYGYIAVPAVLCTVVLVFLTIFVFPKTKRSGQWLLFHMPGTKTLVQDTELSRLGYLLGILLSAGLPVTLALDSLRRATNFYAYKKLYGHMLECIEMGLSLDQSITSFPHAKKYMPVTMHQMIAAGERSGALPETLLRIGEICEAKTEITMKNLSVLLEPLLLVIVWLGVVSVAMAVIFPIYSLIGGLN